MVIGEALDIGIGEYRISPGAHICGFYSASAERDALLSSYVRGALRSGDKCICVLDPPEAAHMRRIVTGAGDNFAATTRSRDVERTRRTALWGLRFGLCCESRPPR